MASNGTSANPTRATKGRPKGLDMTGRHAPTGKSVSRSTGTQTQKVTRSVKPSRAL